MSDNESDIGAKLLGLLADRMPGTNDMRSKRPYQDQVDDLREVLEAYNRTFQVGDLVTPRKGSNLRGRGQPHIIVEVNGEATPDWDKSDHTSHNYGRRPQLRMFVAMNSNETPEDQMVPFWVEAWQLEPWDEARAPSQETVKLPEIKGAEVVFHAKPDTRN